MSKTSLNFLEVWASLSHITSLKTDCCSHSTIRWAEMLSLPSSNVKRTSALLTSFRISLRSLACVDWSALNFGGEPEKKQRLKYNMLNEYQNKNLLAYSTWLVYLYNPKQQKVCSKLTRLPGLYKELVSESCKPTCELFWLA